MELYEQLAPGWNAQEMPSMPGTASPAQMAKQNQQQALVDALRTQQPQQAVRQAGNVVAATGGLAEGLNPQAIGGALKQGYGKLTTPGDLAGTEFI